MLFAHIMRVICVVYVAVLSYALLSPEPFGSNQFRPAG